MSVTDMIAKAVAAHAGQRRPAKATLDKKRTASQTQISRPVAGTVGAKLVHSTGSTEAHEKEKAPSAQAFGYTFVLAPSFCLKIGKEDAVLLAAFSRHQGLAILVHSEMKAHELLASVPNADALLGPETLLGAGAQRLLQEPNAGGASRISEAFSMEVLSRAFGATLDKTEMQITYWPASGSITDFSIMLEGVPLGVSVTRAMTAPHLPFDETAAQALLVKKLGGVIRSTETCLGAWRKQILHVWSPSARATEALETAYASLSHTLVCDTVVLVTTCEGLPQLFQEKMTRPVERVHKVPKGLKEEAHLAILAESDPCRGHAIATAADASSHGRNN